MEVKDQSGAHIVATGSLRSASGATSRSYATDSQGSYSFSGLPVGRYTLSVTRDGFAPKSVTMDVGAVPVTQVVTLQLAAQASSVDVVAATPLAGTDLELNQIPTPVQTASARDLERTGAVDLADLFNKSIASVNVTDNQGSPFQPDLNYRGYSASPLLGTPEGISVYVDGVRQNQPLGDVVSWDLIPKIAVAEVALMPGSNPLFGRNTLGGAVSMETKDGLSAPGTTLRISGGSFGRRAGEFEHGGSTKKGTNYYLAGNLFREDGWRQHSPSEVRQIFAKVGQRFARTSVGLSFGYANNWLVGNGTQDQRWLARDYSSVFTITDVTWNRSPSLTLNVKHDVNASVQVAANGYFRYVRADTINPNLNGESFGESLYNLGASDIAALNAAGYKNFPTTGNATTMPFPFWRCLGQALSLSEPIEKCNAFVGRTYNFQHNFGASGQVSWRAGRNRLIAGASLDHSSLTYQRIQQFGYLNADRISITLVPAFADGSTTSNNVPVDSRVNLHGSTHTPSLFLMDTFSLDKWTFTIAGRYNHTSLDNRDRLPGFIRAQPGSSGGRASLNGNYSFDRFNPSVGLTYAPIEPLGLYFNYSEANRTPTTIELGCADPNYPCNLPNALVSDPPLKQVVTRTFESGARGKVGRNFNWSAGWFFGQNYNDLLFVASAQTGFGYFLNFGKTRRTGIELSMSKKLRSVTMGGNYTFQNATYQSSQTVSGGANSFSDGGKGLDGDIKIKPGNFIPQIPRNVGKAYVEWEPTPKIEISLDFRAVGRSYARGNENNLHQPDGVYYLGQGFSPGYGVLSLGGHYQVTRRIQAFVEINNLLNHRYYTGAQLATTPFDNNYNFVGRPFAAVNGEFPLRTTTFVAPGAPIGAHGGIRLQF